MLYCRFLPPHFDTLQKEISAVVKLFLIRCYILYTTKYVLAIGYKYIKNRTEGEKSIIIYYKKIIFPTLIIRPNNIFFKEKQENPRYTFERSHCIVQSQEMGPATSCHFLCLSSVCIINHNIISYLWMNTWIILGPPLLPAGHLIMSMCFGTVCWAHASYSSTLTPTLLLVVEK